VAIVVAIGIVVAFQPEFIISIAILISGLYGMTKLWRLSNADAKAFVEAYQSAMKEYASRVEEWNRIKALPTKFIETKQKLVAAKSMFTELPALRARKLAELNATRRQRQLQHFLESYRIEDAVLSGIGKGRKELLRAYNVADADDVAPSTISNIKGFGPTMRATLLAWRSSLELTFQFDPNRGIDPGDARAIEQEMNQRRADAIRALANGHKYFSSHWMSGTPSKVL
jgi:DNA-binding helix-hairpin-helix protein with protein kinase domain